MKHYTNKLVEQKRLDKVSCDKCKKEFYSDLGISYPGVELIIEATYGSDYDELNIRFDLCDDCTDTVVKFVENK